MTTMLNFVTTDHRIGLNTRSRCDGPESDLVHRFASAIVPSFQTRSRHKHLAIFYEPALETGFPDLVITVYDPRRFEDWSASRAALDIQDLKILNHLYHVGCSGSLAIGQQLGIRERVVDRAVEHLHDAGLLRRSREVWRPLPLSRTFGIKRLVAIEAKIADWRSVFQQASKNRWFASETYVLSPVSRPAIKTIERSKQLSIGIYTCSDMGVTEVTSSAQHPLPLCYASWLFNEWIGRSLFAPRSSLDC